MAAEGTAGVIPVEGNISLSDAMNATSSAQGGRISNGMIFNSSGGSLGLVKMLAIAGVALIAFRIYKGKK